MKNLPGNLTPTIQGMFYKLEMINAISKNMSNLDTLGYKRIIPEGLSFRSVLDSSAPKTQMRDKSEGAISKTGKTFDLAISGDAEFLVEGKDGVTTSRDGDFHLNEKGNLVNNSNQELVIIEKNDKKISLATTDDITIKENGDILVGREKYGKVALQISGKTPVKIIQGSLEGSNVNLMTEVTSLSLILRSFEASEKILGMETSVDKELIERYGRNV